MASLPEKTRPGIIAETSLNLPRIVGYFATNRRLLTPKAFANFSPGFERSENPEGNNSRIFINPERVPSRMPNAFSVNVFFISLSQGCRYAPTAGLELANAFGV